MACPDLLFLRNPVARISVYTGHLMITVLPYASLVLVLVICQMCLLLVDLILITVGI